MKKNILVQLFSLSLSFGLFSMEVNIGGQRNIDIDIDISEVPSREVRLRVDYTGSISGICGIKVKSSLPISKVFDEVKFKIEPKERDEFSATFDLIPDLYVDWLEMEVISGETLKDVLRRLGMKLFASSVQCQKRGTAK